ncbi:MAG: protoporphyrinogen oxidase [Candidatus Hydrogenedentes bacterium]|nr:protoporphyrinogen oxidase [Candidatus Hydrogenedentota bacterium]
MEKKIIVIGAGVSGLCAAYYLRKALGEDAVLTLEASSCPGGTTRSDQQAGYTLDWGSNGFLDREPLTLAWAKDLGLESDTLKANTAAAKRFIYRNDRLHEVQMPPGFFLSSLLSLRGRLRLCCEPLIKQKRDDTEESVFEFAARRIGKEAAQIMVGSMVLGIYGGNAKELSMRHCFPRMVKMEQDHGGLFKALLAIRRKRGASPMGPPGVLTTFKGGIGALPELAAKTLHKQIRYNAKVTEVTKREGGYEVHLEQGERLAAQAVVLATPAHAAAAISASLHADAADALAAIPYAGLNVACLGYRRDAVAHDLNGFGFLVPRGQGLRLLGCIWTSTLFPFEAPQGSVLLRVMVGGASDPDAVHLSDEETLALVRKELDPLLGLQGEPELSCVYRHPRAIPQYTLGHGKRLKTIEDAEKALPGLVFAGNAYYGIGLNDCVLSAHRAVKMVLEELA